MEDNLTLPELEAILEASREKEMRHHRFLAALKGINLDKESTDSSRFDDVKRRVEARQSGQSQEVLELDELGIDVETD